MEALGVLEAIKNDKRRREGEEKYGFSLCPFDYPNNGLKKPLWIYELSWCAAAFMSDDRLMEFADEITRLGAKNERYVRDFAKGVREWLKMIQARTVYAFPLNISHLANCVYIEKHAEYGWLTDDDRAAMRAFAVLVTEASACNSQAQAMRVLTCIIVFSLCAFITINF